MAAVNENIEHAGRVERIEGDTVYVAITSNSACGTCRARKACGVSESTEKIIEVETADAADYAVGDDVTVAVRRKAGMRAVVFAYVVPLVVLIVVLAGVKASGGSDGAAAAGAMAGVAVYYGCLWLLRERMAEQIRFTIRKNL